MGKNHKVFLRKPKQILFWICVKLHGNKWKAVPARWKAEQAGCEDEKKNWEQLMNTA